MYQAPQLSLRTESLTYSNGVRGVAQTLGIMRRLVQEGRVDPVILSAARSIVYLTPEKDPYSEAEAIFDHVKDHIRYVGDIHEVETISSAAKTLLGKVGDCDDKSILLASLLEAVGYPTRFVVAGYSSSRDLEHVYVQVCLDGQWIDADATEPFPLGYFPPDPTVIYTERV